MLEIEALNASNIKKWVKFVFQQRLKGKDGRFWLLEWSTCWGWTNSWNHKRINKLWCIIPPSPSTNKTCNTYDPSNKKKRRTTMIPTTTTTPPDYIPLSPPKPQPTTLTPHPQSTAPANPSHHLHFYTTTTVYPLLIYTCKFHKATAPQAFLSQTNPPLFPTIYKYSFPYIPYTNTPFVTKPEDHHLPSKSSDYTIPGFPNTALLLDDPSILHPRNMFPMQKRIIHGSSATCHLSLAGHPGDSTIEDLLGDIQHNS